MMCMLLNSLSLEGVDLASCCFDSSSHGFGSSLIHSFSLAHGPLYARFLCLIDFAFTPSSPHVCLRSTLARALPRFIASELIPTLLACIA